MQRDNFFDGYFMSGSPPDSIRRNILDNISRYIEQLSYRNWMQYSDLNQNPAPQLAARNQEILFPDLHQIRTRWNQIILQIRNNQVVDPNDLEEIKEMLREFNSENLTDEPNIGYMTTSAQTHNNFYPMNVHNDLTFNMNPGLYIHDFVYGQQFPSSHTFGQLFPGNYSFGQQFPGSYGNHGDMHNFRSNLQQSGLQLLNSGGLQAHNTETTQVEGNANCNRLKRIAEPVPEMDNSKPKRQNLEISKDEDKKFKIGNFKIPYLKFNSMKLPQPESDSYAINFYEREHTYIIVGSNTTAGNVLKLAQNIPVVRNDVTGPLAKSIRQKIAKDWSRIYQKNYKRWDHWWTDFKFCEEAIDSELEKYKGICLKHKPFVNINYNIKKENLYVKTILNMASVAFTADTDNYQFVMAAIFQIMDFKFLAKLSKSYFDMGKLQDIIRRVPNSKWIYIMRSMVYLWFRFKAIQTAAIAKTITTTQVTAIAKSTTQAKAQSTTSTKAIAKCTTQATAIAKSTTQDKGNAQSITSAKAIAKCTTQATAIAKSTTQDKGNAQSITSAKAIAKCTTQDKLYPIAIAKAQSATLTKSIAKCTTQAKAIAKSAPQATAIAKSTSQDTAKAKSSTQAKAIVKFTTEEMEIMATKFQWENPLFHWLAKQAFDELKRVSEIEYSDHWEMFYNP